MTPVFFLFTRREKAYDAPMKEDRKQSKTGKRGLTRRASWKLGTCGVAAMAAGVAPLVSREFYDEGVFGPEKAAEAYREMMKRFGYPVSEALQSEQLWTCDFLQGDFSKLGIGGIFWINALEVYGKSGAGLYRGDFRNARFGYMGLEIFLLPGQALPEHSHLGGPDGVGPKMEAWLVRHGEVEFFGEHQSSGEETLIEDMPESGRPWGYGEPWFRSKYVAKRSASSGQIYSLADPESWHFQRAGAEGAIVTEFATCHNHVQFSKPGMEFENTGHRQD